MRKLVVIAAGLVLSSAPVAAQTPRSSEGGILSAFFGLDRSLRIAVATARTCEGIGGSDGMPVIFSHEVDATTLAPEDFRVTMASGAIGDVGCVTLRPADEPGELRTALLISRFGSSADQPATVEIIGDITSLDGAVNFRGATATVTPLEAGPTLVLAETLSRTEWTVGGGSDCSAEGLLTIVRATWAGGVSRADGDAVGSREAEMYRVTLRRPDGGTVTVSPMAIGDLNDNDNNHDLCLGVAGEPVSVFFLAGRLVDPNDDANPDTEIAVSARP
ncbi:hypothetical protein [Brevundimonas sp. LM2]|uniref:hypothetical protein n=1 Tax=Brevundimonas sp. LM2 TaxID=1938605 RepID=UPI0009865268|nr:hypothetical protein [Brevundimonas sp. LM2]